jgi:hypothetical protein
LALEAGASGLWAAVRRMDRLKEKGAATNA